MRRRVGTWWGVLAVVVACAGCEFTLDDDPQPLWFRPGIREGSDHFHRARVLDAPQIGTITDIVPHACGAGAKGIAVAGTRGALCVDADGKVIATVLFPPSAAAPTATTIVDVDRDGQPEFWRCSREATRCSLVDGEGRERWGVDREGRFWTWAFGDFDSDGSVEIAVADRSAGPITLYARDGARRWTAGESVSIDFLAAGDVDDDQVPDLLAVGDRRLAVIDKNGRVKGRRKLALDGDIANYAVAPCGGEANPLTFLATVKSGFMWLDVTGKLIAKLDGRAVTAPSAAFLRGGDRERYCAILGTLLARDPDGATLDRGRLQVYAAHGAMVYDEVFDRDADAIADIDDGDELWIGEQSRVWRYRWRDAATLPAS